MILRLIVWQAPFGFICTLLLLRFLDLPSAVSVLYLGVPLAVTGCVLWLTARKRAIRSDERFLAVVATVLSLAIALFIYVPGRAALLDARRIHDEAIERGRQRDRQNSGLPTSDQPAD